MACGLLAATSLQLVAQGMVDVSIANILNASATAVLGVLAFMLATKSIPAIVSTNAESAAKVADQNRIAAEEAAKAHAEAIQAAANAHGQVVKDLLSEAKQERDRFHADMNSFAESIRSLATTCAAHQALTKAEKVG